MSESLTTTSDNAANPLDIMEQIVAANEWEFDRRSDSEMAAEARAATLESRLAALEARVAALESPDRDTLVRGEGGSPI